MKLLVWLICLVGLTLAAAYFLGPRETLTPDRAFLADDIGPDPAAYLADLEQAHPDIRAGQAKQIVWAGAAGARTDWAVVYLHGFSASAAEIRPVPDRLAAALGANLHFTRLTGHGRDGPALADARAGDWINDTAEALEIGRRIGERVLVIATSTGGTLAALASRDPKMARNIAGIAYVSPNFGIKNPQAWILTLPFARQIVPMIAGETRSWEPYNAAQDAGWTTSYPTTAVLPMAALVKAMQALPPQDLTIPAFFAYADGDQVIEAARVADFAARYGGPVTIWKPRPDQIDDPSLHVLTGDILAPRTTEAAVERLLAWARSL